MKILGEIVEVEYPHLYLPWFHRIAPSLKTGTEVHGVLIPGETADLYLSPYPTTSWTDLWRINCEFADRPGLFADLTGLLGDPFVNVNILAHETSTRPHEGVFEVTLICDMTGYGGERNPDWTSSERVVQEHATLRYLCDYLICEMFRDLKFRKGKPQIEITRLRELHRIGLLLRRRRNSIRALPSGVKIDRGNLALSHEWWGEIFATSETRGERARHWVTIASDTEERYIKISTLPRQREVCLLSVFHTDKPNQIARFSEAVAGMDRRDDVNIQCSYLRLQSAGKVAEWRCLLDARKTGDLSLESRVKRALFCKNENWTDSSLRVRFNDPLDSRNEPWGVD